MLSAICWPGLCFTRPECSPVCFVSVGSTLSATRRLGFPSLNCFGFFSPSLRSSVGKEGRTGPERPAPPPRFEPYDVWVNVGHDVDPVSDMPGPKVTGAQVKRQRGIPELPQGAPQDGHPLFPRVTAVLDDD